MSWFTKKLRQYVPQARGQSLTPTGAISGATDFGAQFVSFTAKTFVTDPMNLWGRGDISGGINKVGSTLFAQDEGSVWGEGSRFLHTMRDVRKHPAFGFADKATDYMISDKYQDVFKGTPNIGIPNIPMPGHGAIKYLNERTQQLRFVQSKAEMLNAYGNEGIMKGGRFGGDILDRYKGNPALLLAGPYGLVFAAYQTAAKNIKKSMGDKTLDRIISSVSVGTEEATPKPAKIVKGSGSLLGKSARFSMAKSGKNQGRSSLKIGRKGTGGGEGASHFKSYRSGRRSEY